MKKLLLVLSLLSPAAFAETSASPSVFSHDANGCPDLTGTFEIATRAGGKVSIRFESKKEGEMPVLMMTANNQTTKIEIDGKAHEFDGYEIVRACQGGAYQESSRNPDDGKVFENLVFSLDDSRNLVMSKWVAPWFGGGEVVRTVLTRAGN